MPVLEPPLPLPAAPRLSLPVTRRRLAPGALVSLAVHAALVGALLWQSAARLAQLGTGSAGGGGERPAVNFFALPAPAPAAVELPPTPRVQLTALPPLQEIKLDVPAIAPALESAAAPGGAASGGGGQGAGPGTGSAAGPGSGGGGDYIIASPRTAILPPLAKVPGSVAGRTYRVRFWVSADGRVTRVEVDPPIRDEAYRQDLVQRMMAYKFNPARTRDGANVSSVVTVSLRIGN